MANNKEKAIIDELMKEKDILNDKLAEFNQEYANDIDLRVFFKFLKKKIMILILAAVVGAALMGIYSLYVVTPIYESTAKLYVISQSTSITSYADIQLNSELAQDYKEMILSYPVVKKVIEDLDLDYSYKQVVKNMVEVENPEDTRVINIKVKSDSPEEAATMANRLAIVAKRTIADIMDTDEPRIFEHGRIATNPVNLNMTKNLAIGFITGGILAVIILLIIFVAKDIIRTPEDIQRRLNGNVLAIIPKEKGVRK